MSIHKKILLTGAALGGLSVALGAFGAHALKPLLLEHQSTETYALAAHYQFYHALALIALGILTHQASNEKTFAIAAGCMAAGVLLFSGSLYVLALTGSRAVVLLTPLGGMFFLAGWIVFFAAVYKNKQGPEGPRQ